MTSVPFRGWFANSGKNASSTKTSLLVAYSRWKRIFCLNSATLALILPAPAGMSISVQCIPRASSSRFMQDRLSGSVLLFEARSTFFSSIGFFAARP